jgi:hypothetical protein
MKRTFSAVILTFKRRIHAHLFYVFNDDIFKLVRRVFVEVFEIVALACGSNAKGQKVNPGLLKK